MKKRKKLKVFNVSIDNSEVLAVSLVEKPAIEQDFLFFDKDEKKKMYFESDEKHMIVGPVMIAGENIYRYDPETDYEYYINFGEDVVRKLAYDYLMKNRGNNFTLDHKDDTDGVFICESWIVEDPEKDKASFYGFNLPKGTWMMSAYVDSNSTWEKIKENGFNGFSIESIVDFDTFNEAREEEMSKEMNYFKRVKEMILEAISPSQTTETDVENVENSELPANPVNEEVTDNTTENQEVIDEPVVEEPVEVVEENVEEKVVSESPVNEELVNQISSLSELVKTLQEEVSALREQNSTLNETIEKKDVEIKQLESEPSSDPVNINANNTGNAFKSWRETMKHLI